MLLAVLVRRLSWLPAVVLAAFALGAQESPPKASTASDANAPTTSDAKIAESGKGPGQGPGQEPVPVRNQALRTLAQQLAEVEVELRAALAEKPPRAERITPLQQQQAQLRDRLASLATGVDVAVVRSPTDERYELQSELLRLVRPLVRALSKATEGPRQIQELQAHQDQLDAQLLAVDQVVRGLSRTRDDQREARAEPQLLAELDAAVQRWGAFASELRDERVLVAAQLDALERARAPVAETVQNAVADFVRRRGVSLVLAIGAATVVVVLLRWLQRVFARLAARGERRLPLRLFDIAFQFLAVLGAMLAVVLVFYLRGDFELLAVAIVFLIGVGWALSRALPTLLEQMRLLLNAGAVREGERLLLDGLPYRVEALRLYSRLVNPDLQGGVLRVPIKDLVGRASRRSLPDEPWFPCRVGDWVQLGNGAFGPVETATPDVVVMRIDGAPRSYKTTDFLAEKPANLSQGFVLSTIFGVDYRHQREVTTSIPDRFREALLAALPDLPGGSAANSVVVEFANANSSSLDLQAVVRFGGAAAPSVGALRRGLQRILLEASTRHGYSIPFPQLTVHRGVADGA